MSKTKRGSFRKLNTPPLQRLSALWAWLPAFRATAEAGSLAGAARLLGASPPALSRTLRLLEAEVGEPLFVRAGGSALRLNDAGTRLFAQVRAAMRLVDDGLPGARTPRVAVPAGCALDASSLEDGVVVEDYDDRDAAVIRLRTGQIDGVVVVGGGAPAAGLVATPLPITVSLWTRAAVAAEKKHDPR